MTQIKPDFSVPIQVIADWLEAQRDYANVPGISAGVVVGRELIWSDGFGYADLKAKTEATAATLFSICSISKLFTAIAIMQLRDQGKLGLDDEISEYLPWLNIEQTYAKGGPITIRSVLTHSSGLPRESDYPYWTDPTFPFPTEEKLKQRLAEQKTLYPASTFYQYSNLGMSLLGQIVAELSDVPYEKYVADNILIPMGLADTRAYMPTTLHGGQLATGYGVESRTGSREELALFNAKALAPAMGYTSSVEDLAKFATWQLHVLEDVDDPILNGNTLREMHRVHWMDPVEDVTWGLGFRVDRLDKTIAVGHSGGCPGYLTQLALFPEKQWALVVMVNGLGIDTEQYLMGMYSILDAYDKEQIEETSSLDDLEAYRGRYYSFWSGESVVVPWRGKLAVFDLRSPSQKKPETLMQQIEGDIFKRIGDDGKLKEEIRFERNERGQVTRFWQHSQYTSRMDS